MRTASTRTLGLASAGEYATLIRPTYYAGQTPGVIYCHGSSATDTEAILGATGLLSLAGLLHAVASEGYPLLSAHNAGETWGNDTVISRIADDRTAVQAAGAKAGKVVLIGGSMGGCNVLNYARANPANVACLVLIRPVLDLQDFGSRNGFSGINGAYGGAYNNTTDGPTHNPVLFASQVANIPTLLLYASDDTICVASTVTAFTTARGASGLTVVDIAPGGHTNTADSHIDQRQVVDFINAYRG